MENGSPLSHPTTLRIFLYFKLNEPGEFGVREMQRIIGVKSTSTVSWHFSKLTDAGLLQQLPSKTYGLTKLGASYADIHIPVNIPAQVILGRFVPKYSFLLGVLFVGFILNILLLLLGANPLYVAFAAIVVILIALITIFREWLAFQNKYEDFQMLNKKKH
ncbi:MAG: helix-turn-helix domain-containing protein [Candidatus Kariarchaeaceae archaeon]